MEPRTTDDLNDKDLVRMIAQSDASVKTGVSVEHGKAELNRRLMESIKNLDKTTTTYSKKIYILTFVLFFLGLGQLVVSIFTLGLNWYMVYRSRMDFVCNWSSNFYNRRSHKRYQKCFSKICTDQAQGDEQRKNRGTFSNQRNCYQQ